MRDYEIFIFLHETEWFLGTIFFFIWKLKFGILRIFLRWVFSRLFFLFFLRKFRLLMFDEFFQGCFFGDLWYTIFTKIAIFLQKLSVIFFGWSLDFGNWWNFYLFNIIWIKILILLLVNFYKGSFSMVVIEFLLRDYEIVIFSYTRIREIFRNNFFFIWKLKFAILRIFFTAGFE